MAETGHNVAGVAGEKLASFVERIERLDAQKRELTADTKEIYAEAKGNGFDTNVLRKIIAKRRRDKDDIDEEETLIAIYERALGEYAKTPLGSAAMKRAAE